jgi:hypothetical protein
LLFALSRFGFITSFYSLPNRLFVPCTMLYFLAAFKMGVKNFWTAMILLISPRCLLFVAPRYFRFSPPPYLSALHDSLFPTEMPLFQRLRQDSLFLPSRPFCCVMILLFSPRRHLLLHHDIYGFTEMPSF